MRTASGTISKHVIYGILMGVIKIDMTKFGGYLALTTLQQNEHVAKYSNSILTCNNIFVVGRGLNTIPQ